MRILLTVIALSCAADRALAVDVDDVLFFAAFEGSADATLAGGSAKAEIRGKPQFAEGVRGKAFVANADTMLAYLLKNNCRPDEGTVMMWVRPEWRSDDGKFHHFFRASTGNHGGKALNGLMLYKYQNHDKLLFYTSNGEKTSPQEGRTLASHEPLRWEPRRWVHLAATWSSTLENTEMYLYVNGRRAAAAAGGVFVPDKAPDQFTVGGPKGSGTTWFDDVLVFSRPLMAKEIAAIYASYASAAGSPGELPFALSRELPLRAAMLFARDELLVEVDCRGARREFNGRPARVEVTLEQSGRTVKRDSALGEAFLAKLRYAYPKLSVGACRLKAALVDEHGKIVRTGELTYEIPARPAWLGNRLGKEDVLLPPWTPLEISPQSVGMWGRRYDFRQGPLPDAVTSQGRPLLRAPITMSVQSAGQAAALRATPAAGFEGRPTMARGRWTGSLGSWSMEASSQVEFDGLVRIDLELRLRAAEEIEALTLRIPLRSESATLYHHADGTWTDNSDAGGVGPIGWSKRLPFVPYFWVGDEQGGLAWWCEENQAWRNADERRAVELCRTAEGVDLVLRLIDRKTTVDRPLRLTFGFMATPVKPLPAGWRDWRQAFVSSTNLQAMLARNPPRAGCRNIANLWNNHVGSFSYLPADPAAMRKKVELVHAAGWQTVISYFALDYTQTGTPDFTIAEREWRRNPYAEVDSHTFSYATVCNASDWADFLIWALNKTMDETGTDGVYFDCCNPNFCCSPDHGCAPGRYPLLATRELMKRAYTVVKQKRGSAGFVYCHNSENNLLTTFSFADAVLNGEQYNRKDLRTLSLDKFRAELSSQPYGVPAVLLPTLVKFQPGGREKMPGAEFLAFPLLHDVLCSASWLSKPSQDFLHRVEQIYKDFGVADAQFFPYWSNAGEIRQADSSARISAYLRPDVRAALLVAQSCGPSAHCRLKLAGRLGALEKAAARDALSGQPLTWEQGQLQWDLPDRSVRLAILQCARR